MRSSRILFTFPLLALPLAISGSVASAQPVYKPITPATFKAPKADLEKWATRIKKLCPPQGWTVKIENNDVLVQRDKPVTFSGETPFIEGIYRLRLRFAPAMSQDKYETLTAQNNATETKKQALLDKHEIFELLDDYVGEIKAKPLEARKQAYLAESKKLVFNLLPDFYTPDASITFYHSWGWYDYVAPSDAAVEKECNTVLESIARFFGNYDQRAATGKIPRGWEEPKK